MGEGGRVSIADRVAESSARFTGVVWPTVKPFFGDGDLVPVEAHGRVPAYDGFHLSRQVPTEWTGTDASTED